MTVSAELYDLVDVASREYRGLELSLNAARARRRALGRELALVPARYREPALTVEEAKERARSLLRDRQGGHPGVSFEDVELHGYHPMVYTFVTASPEWRAEGRMPGGLLCSIDKVDGHAWSPADFERYAELNAAG